MNKPKAPVRRHSREGGNPVPFTSCTDTQRHWIPDAATRFRDDDQTQGANNLKSGWVVAPISEIADHCLGKMLDKQKNKGVLRPYLRNLNVRWFGFDLSDVLQMRFEEGEADRYQAKKGDLIICEGGYPGRAAIWESDDPICLQKALHRVRFHEPERAKWVLYWLYLLDMSGTLMESFTGAGIQHFTKAALARFEVPLPPLDEQKRIVAVLDQAFAALDRARANVEANLADAQGLFLSALRSVFSNDSKKWREIDALAFEAFAGLAIANKRSKDATQTGGRNATTRRIEGNFSLSVLMPEAEAREGWVWSPLSKLARLESGHTPSRRHPEYWGGEIGWLGIKDARDYNGGMVVETREQTNTLGINNSSARVLPKGTVCLSRTASIGYVVIMGTDMATSQDFVNWVCGPHIEPEFLQLLLLAQGEEIRKFASGSVHQTIYFPEVKAFHVCHPSVDIQREICRSLNRVKQDASKIEAGYQAKLNNLTNLRQSLLRAAFSGQLS